MKITERIPDDTANEAGGSDTVLAVIQDRYGPADEVLEVGEIERPSPSADEVLVRVRATAVAGDDWHLMQGLPYVARLEAGIRKPKRRVPGRDVAGSVEAVGDRVDGFRPGDEVFGWFEGAFAELAAVPAGALAPKPANLTFEEAAAVPISGFTALQALRDKGEVSEGDEVLVIGASGGVGTFAVQIAKSLGARVTGVCGAANAELVRELGADEVIDYRTKDFAADGSRFDVIVDLVGNRKLADLRRALAPDGRLVMVGGTGGRWFKGTQRWLSALAISPFIAQKLRPQIHSPSREDLEELARLLEAGELKPVISARYPLDKVSEAVGRFAGGHGRGKVAVTV